MFSFFLSQVFFLSKNNLMGIIHILVCDVYFSFVNQTVKNLNETRAIKQKFFSRVILDSKF